MILRGTKVKRKLEFFTLEGWVVGDGQLRSGQRMVMIEIDIEKSNGSVAKESQIFCCHEDSLTIVV